MGKSGKKKAGGAPKNDPHSSSGVQPPAPPSDAFSAFNTPKSLAAVKALMRDFSVAMSLHTKLASAITSNIGSVTSDSISEVSAATTNFHKAFIRLDAAIDAFDEYQRTSLSSHSSTPLFTPPSGATQEEWWASPSVNMSSYLTDVVQIKPGYGSLPFRVGTSEQVRS